MWQAVLVEGFGTRHPAIAILTHLWSVVCTRKVLPAFHSGELFCINLLMECVGFWVPSTDVIRAAQRDCMQQMRSGGQATAMAAAHMHQEEETVKVVTRSC